jgi:CBS domain containing-hemolysin-like protein
LRHTLGAAGVGAQAQLIWGSEYVSVISIVLTIIILVLSEIIPKTLGAIYWRQLAGLSSTILKFLITIFYPFVFVSRLITKLLKRKRERKVEREDVEAISEIGYREGILGKEESVIIRNLLRLNKLRAKDIMTPRTVVLAADENEIIVLGLEIMDETDNIEYLQKLVKERWEKKK